MRVSEQNRRCQNLFNHHAATKPRQRMKHMNRLRVFLVLVVALAVHATAQLSDRNTLPGSGLARNEAECVAQFRGADLKSDNFLSPREVSQSRSLIPSELSGETSITRQHFLSVATPEQTPRTPG